MTFRNYLIGWLTAATPGEADAFAELAVLVIVLANCVAYTAGLIRRRDEGDAAYGDGYKIGYTDGCKRRYRDAESRKQVMT